MKDIHFSSKEKFDQYFIGAELFENQGVHGYTYKKGNQVIKKIDPFCNVSESALLQFRNVYIPHVYFIRAGIYVRKKLKACISEYASGHSLAETRVYGQKIDTLLKAIQRFEETIKNLSQEGIRIKDVLPGNILFNEDHFNIIDTVLYRDGTKFSKEELTILNYNDAFFNLFNGIIPYSFFNYFWYRDWFKCDLLQNPEELIEKILDQIEHLVGKSFDTLEEAERTVIEEGIKLPILW